MKYDSCEVKYYRLRLYIILGMTILIFLPILAAIASLGEAADKAIVLIVFMAMIILPMNIYYGYRFFYFKRLKLTNIQEVKLEKIESSDFNRLVSFVIQMEINGEKRQVNTLALFGIGTSGPNIDDYLSKFVLVGYDEKRDIAVILKLLNPNKIDEI